MHIPASILVTKRNRIFGSPFREVLAFVKHERNHFLFLFDIVKAPLAGFGILGGRGFQAGYGDGREGGLGVPAMPVVVPDAPLPILLNYSIGTVLSAVSQAVVLLVRRVVDFVPAPTEEVSQAFCQHGAHRIAQFFCYA